ncbi:MAG: Grx4 family monothiol glutaredoxin [bacterium]
MPDIHEEIDNAVEEENVVIFMKGNARQPMCGFSEAAVEVIQSYDVDFETYDVLQDDELRQGIKEYSDWPTIPQVYINGEFVGGSDIVREMHQKGDLEPLIDDAKSS